MFSQVCVCSHGSLGYLCSHVPSGGGVGYIWFHAPFRVIVGYHWSNVPFEGLGYPGGRVSRPSLETPKEGGTHPIAMLSCYLCKCVATTRLFRVGSLIRITRPEWHLTEMGLLRCNFVNDDVQTIRRECCKKFHEYSYVLVSSSFFSV